MIVERTAETVFLPVPAKAFNVVCTIRNGTIGNYLLKSRGIESWDFRKSAFLRENA